MADGTVRYKPIYLERGRKLVTLVPCFNSAIDINLYTSRGDGNFSQAFSTFLNSL